MNNPRSPTLRRVTLSLATLVFGVAATAATAEDAPIPSIHRVTLSQAPKIVQDDVASFFAMCDLSAKTVRAAALVDVGPIGGPGRTDYYFDTSENYWRDPIGQTTHFDYRCATTRIYSMLWMQTKSGKYRYIPLSSAFLYFKSSHLLISTPTPHFERKNNCARADAWWDCVRLLAWDSKAAAFHRITGNMTLDESDVWVKAHGYSSYPNSIPTTRRSQP
jgi:hypothetical protein